MIFYRIRNNISVDELFKDFPIEMKFIFKSLKNWSINDIPDYEIYIRNLENALNDYIQNIRVIILSLFGKKMINNFWF